MNALERKTAASLNIAKESLANNIEMAYDRIETQIEDKREEILAEMERVANELEDWRRGRSIAFYYIL